MIAVSTHSILSHQSYESDYAYHYDEDDDDNEEYHYSDNEDEDENDDDCLRYNDNSKNSDPLYGEETSSSPLSEDSLCIRNTKMNSNSNINPSFITENEAKKMMNDSVEDLSELLQINNDVSIVLLRKNNWDIQIVTEKYFSNNREQFLEECGVSHDDIQCTELERESYSPASCAMVREWNNLCNGGNTETKNWTSTDTMEYRTGLVKSKNNDKSSCYKDRRLSCTETTWFVDGGFDDDSFNDDSLHSFTTIQQDKCDNKDKASTKQQEAPAKNIDYYFDSSDDEEEEQYKYNDEENKYFHVLFNKYETNSEKQINTQKEVDELLAEKIEECNDENENRLEFIKALTLLVECRRVLKYSCVFIHSSSRSVDTTTKNVGGAQRVALLEENLTILENLTEEFEESYINKILDDKRKYDIRQLCGFRHKTKTKYDNQKMSSLKEKSLVLKKYIQQWK